MIDQQDLTAYLQKNIPGFRGIDKNEKQGDVYAMVKQLLKHTTVQVAKHNIEAAKHCLSVAEQLYNKGNGVVKNAIENVFVFSFSHAFFSDEHKRREIIDIVPSSLYNLYKKQVINSHL
jgi:hypothetical protein